MHPPARTAPFALINTLSQAPRFGGVFDGRCGGRFFLSLQNASVVRPALAGLAVLMSCPGVTPAAFPITPLRGVREIGIFLLRLAFAITAIPFAPCLAAFHVWCPVR